MSDIPMIPEKYIGFDAPLEIKLYENLISSPVWQLLPAAWAELERYGHNPPRNAYPHHDAGVLVASYENVGTAGFIIYKANDQSEYSIQMAYTKREFRRMGIHSKLFEALIVRAEINDILAIVSGTSVDNIAAQKAFEKQGRHAYSINYEYVIRPFAKALDPNLKIGA